MRPLTLFLSGILGNRVVSQQLRDACASAGIPVGADIPLDGHAYERLSRAGWRHAGSAEMAVRTASESFKRYSVPRGAIVLANSWELALGAAVQPQVERVVLAADMFPDAMLLKRCGWLNDGITRTGLRLLAAYRQRHSLKAVAGKFVSFLPLTSLAQAAFARTFGERVQRWPPTLSAQPHFAASDERGRLAGSPPLLLFVGNDLERKGISTFLETVALLRRTRPVDAQVVTNDPRAQALLAGHAVELITGVHEAQAMRSHYREADLLLFPTRRDALGLVVAESLANGTPAVTSDVGGLGDLVIPGVTGVRHSPTARPVDYARTCSALLDDESQLLALRSSTLAWAREHLGWNAFVEKVESAVEEARM